MEETRTSGLRPQDKKVANHEWRLFIPEILWQDVICQGRAVEEA